MTDASYSHKFMRALADSLGWNPEAVQKAFFEIAQLQNQTQKLELSVQGKAPANHASQQGVFGLADERMYGHVKVTHEVTNDSTAGVAVSPDAVYAYADPAGYCVPYSKFPPKSYGLPVSNKIPGVTVSVLVGSACLYVEVIGKPETTVENRTVIADLSQGTLWNFYSTPSTEMFFDAAKFSYKNNTILANRNAPAGVYITASFVIPLIVKA